jgi:hypothetical protein
MIRSNLPADDDLLERLVGNRLDRIAPNLCDIHGHSLLRSLLHLSN